MSHIEASPARRDAATRDKAPRALLFEVSWEVCSQAGGIYTVLRSKASAAVATWRDNYWLIGPFREASAKIELEPLEASGPIGAVLARMRERGVDIHHGRWLVSGRPQVLLIDLKSVWQHLPQMKYFLWKDLKISTPPVDPDTDEAVAFGYATADLLGEIAKQTEGRPLLAHFHEWQGGLACPLLKFRAAPFPTVFTTHATLVGRSLSAANVDLYDKLPEIDAELVARQHGIEHRFQIERAAAQAATVFTTVSEITAAEAEQFLGRRPEVVLPNGLNVERFAAPHEFQNLHQQNKERIHEFVMGHFFPSYSFDLERTLYFFSAGRYEYRNKGLDVFIEALHELNRRLKADPRGVTVVAFIVTRAPYRALNVETLNRHAMFNELQGACESIKEEMGKRLFSAVASGRLPTLDDLLDEGERVRLKRIMQAWRQGSQPIIVTHDLEDDLRDPVLCHLRKRRLFNAPDDPVKVVFHPEFVSHASPVFGMDYDQFVRGCNLGVFPSYYEPWGYTPMECIVRGVPAVTSDLAGFGSYIMGRFPDHDENGMYVARRDGVSLETTVYQVAGWLQGMVNMTLRDRISLRNRVESFADEFDWSKMTRAYRAARRLAFDACYPGQDILRPD